MTAVQLINIINQLDNLVLRQIFVQPAAEFRRKIIFAVRKSTGTAKAAHNAAGVAVNAMVNLFGCQRAEALFNRIARLQHNNLQLRILQHKLIGGKNCGRTATDNGNIIHKFSSSSSPIKKPQLQFLLRFISLLLLFLLLAQVAWLRRAVVDILVAFCRLTHKIGYQIISLTHHH